MTNVLIITGPSNSGKDTLRKQLLRLKDQTTLLHGVHILTMHTTRPARKGEVYGEDYFFDTLGDFQNANVLTSARYHDTDGKNPWYYWFDRDDLLVEENKINILFCAMKETHYLYYNSREGGKLSDLNVQCVYLAISEKERLLRALNRYEIEPEGFPEMLRRANADFYDFQEENLEKIGCFKDMYITSGVNAMTDLLIKIHEIRESLSRNLLC